ncbi:MAG: dTDP-4-dehydrorhamnose 3,5-epimerase family protein [Bacteroidota bacterium]|nr:dTDP-4-dehydrorhamnose 3,5-epimerase family protein [Bacteroidota bacterium]
MEVENRVPEGVKIIRYPKFKDLRGSFIKVFNSEFFTDHGLVAHFKESYFSVSDKNVIRGMHFQSPPAETTKLVVLIRGMILDVILDLRKNSSTFGQYLKVCINEDEPAAVYIPVGCAHGFRSLEEDSIVLYLQSQVYSPECDSGIRYDSFGVDWETDRPVLSERDRAFVSFRDFKSPF